MKITELDWTDNKRYTCNGKNYKHDGLDLYLCDKDWNCRADITDEFTLKGILEMDFTEVTDWSQVKQDTPILVRVDEYNPWYKGYFSYVDAEGYFRIYASGGTSWSTDHRCDSFKWQEATTDITLSSREIEC